MCLLQGYGRCTVKKPKTSTATAGGNSRHEGEDLCGAVCVRVSTSPASCLSFMCVRCCLLTTM